LSGLRNASKLLKLLELVPGGNVEATVEARLSSESGTNAPIGGIGSTRIRAQVSRIIGLIPYREATSTMGNKNRNNATNELGEILRLGVHTSGSSAWLVVEHGSTPARSNTGNSELNTEFASSSSLHKVDVAVKLLQSQGTTARVKEMEVEHRADASSSKRFDLIKSHLALSIVNVEEGGFVLSAEFNAVVVARETTRETASPDLLHVDLVSNSARLTSVIPWWASPEGGDHAVNSIGEGGNVSLSRSHTTVADSPLATRKSSPLSSPATTKEALVVLGEALDEASKAVSTPLKSLTLLSIGNVSVEASNAVLNTLDARLNLGLLLRSNRGIGKLSTKLFKAFLVLLLATANASYTTAACTARPSSTASQLVNTSLSLSNALLEASNPGADAISRHRSNTRSGELSLESLKTTLETRKKAFSATETTATTRG